MRDISAAARIPTNTAAARAEEEDLEKEIEVTLASAEFQEVEKQGEAILAEERERMAKAKAAVRHQITNIASLRSY
jgi:hypothetical protein